MIVVTGASGRIGHTLVRQLSERGAAVRAVSRRAERREPLAGVEWLDVDLARRQSTDSVFVGADTVFLLTGNDEDMVRLQRNVLNAAQEAGVRRVVKLSALGASEHSMSVIALWHYNVERSLRESGLGWTILRPHHFMDNVLDQCANIVREGVLYSASGEGRIPFIDTRDIAEVAAVVLTEPGHEGKTYTLTGPQALSYRDATRILSEFIGRPLTYVAETEDEAWARLRRAGEPAWRIAALLAIAAYQRAGGPTEQVTTAVEEILRRAPRSFEQFARDRASSFRDLPRGPRPESEHG